MLRLDLDEPWIRVCHIPTEGVVQLYTVNEVKSFPVGAIVAIYGDRRSEATLAQSVEQLIRNQQVVGSTPTGGSKKSLIKYRSLALQ